MRKEVNDISPPPSIDRPCALIGSDGWAEGGKRRRRRKTEKGWIPPLPPPLKVRFGCHSCMGWNLSLSPSFSSSLLSVGFFKDNDDDGGRREKRKLRRRRRVINP